MARGIHGVYLWYVRRLCSPPKALRCDCQEADVNSVLVYHGSFFPFLPCPSCPRMFPTSSLLFLLLPSLPSASEKQHSVETYTKAWRDRKRNGDKEKPCPSPVLRSKAKLKKHKTAVVPVLRAHRCGLWSERRMRTSGKSTPGPEMLLRAHWTPRLPLVSRCLWWSLLA